MPPHRLSYALEKFTMSVDGMASSAHPLQQRLRNAARTFHVLRTEDLPEGEIRDAYAAITKSLTCVPAMADEGTIEATTSQMTDEEAERVANLIVDFLHTLRYEVESV